MAFWGIVGSYNSPSSLGKIIMILNVWKFDVKNYLVKKETGSQLVKLKMYHSTSLETYFQHLFKLLHLYL